MQKCKFYYVVIREVEEPSRIDSINRLELKLTEAEFAVFPLSMFLNLGYFIAIKKVFEDGEVQDPE